MAPKHHFLKTAFWEGLTSLDVKASLAGAVEHLGEEGEWERNVISPSLVGTECRLSRLKRFLGDDPQPGVTGMGMRAGVRDPVTMINFLRGFYYEALVVPALEQSLGKAAIVGRAPTLLFRWRYDPANPGLCGDADDLKLSMWSQQGKQGMVFAGHPDLLIQDPEHDWGLATVQIKCPSIFKLERIQRMGDEDALKTYRGQMITEMYIGRRMGYPIQRAYLFLGSLEAIASKERSPHVHVVELEWEDVMRTVPEEIGREIVQDYDRAVGFGEWPAAYKEAAWDSFPCSYCQYSRLGNFETIGCEEQSEWTRFAETGLTRLTAAVPEEATNVIPLRRRRRVDTPVSYTHLTLPTKA